MTNPFTAYTFPSTGASSNRTLPARLLDVVNVKDYGALGDGTGALLSSRYASVADAQVDHKGVSTLSDTIDWAAIMSALSWNSIFVKAAAHAYSGAVRVIDVSWAAGTATVTTGVPHGLTTGDMIFHWGTNTDPGTYQGAFTITVSNSTVFTYALASDPGPSSLKGYFLPQIASATWASNVVTVNYAAPHRLITGLTVRVSFCTKNTTMTVSGAASGTAGDIRLTVDSTASTQTGETVSVSGVGGSGGGNADGSRVARIVDGTHLELQGVPFTSGYSNGTVTNTTSIDGDHVITTSGGTPRSLTFALTGSGTLNVPYYAILQPRGILQVVSWPGYPVSYQTGPSAFYMSDYFPVCYAGSKFLQLSDVTGTTLTFSNGNSAFWNDIEVDDIIRLTPMAVGTVFFPPGTYFINKQLQLSVVGVTGVIRGSPGTVIRGSFSDYLLAVVELGGPSRLDNISFVNDDVNGGGVRWNALSSLVSSCKFTAGSVGLDLATAEFNNNVAFSIEVSGCMFFPSPGSTNSAGLGDASNNSAIVSCYFKGLTDGIRSSKFFHCIDGNNFVDCGTGINSGPKPTGVPGTNSNLAIRGNVFKNCGIAIDGPSFSTSRVEGNCIEGGANAIHGYHGISTAVNLVRGLYTIGEFSGKAITPAVNETYGSNRYTLRSVGATYEGFAATRGRFPSVVFAGLFVHANVRSGYFARTLIRKLKILCPNYYHNEQSPGAALSVAASVEYPVGVFTQITFNGDGSTTGTAADGGTLISDYCTVVIPYGEKFWIRLFLQCSAGVVCTVGAHVDNTNSFMGDAFEDSAVDRTMGGTIPAAVDVSYTPGVIAPMTEPSVLIIGDSIAEGGGDTLDASGDLGIIARSIGPKFGYFNAAMTGETANVFVSTHTQRLLLKKYCSHVFVNYGINDINTGDSAATIEGHLTTIYGLFSDKIVKQTTITPNTSSTNGWIDTINQSASGFESVRATLNADLRSTFGPPGGVVDTGAVVETSSKWVPFKTSDGIHPNQSGYLDVQSSGAINTAIMLPPTSQWSKPSIANTAAFDNCNIASVVTYNGLTGRRVVSAVYDSGTGNVTLTTDSSHNIDTGSRVSVSGITVSGSTNNSYNGVYASLSASGSTITYHINFAAGTADSNTGIITTALQLTTLAPIKTISWSAGTVSVETFNVPCGVSDYGLAQVQAVVGGSTVNGYTGTFPIRLSDPTHFTYAVASDPGTVDSPTLTTVAGQSFPVFPSTWVLSLLNTNGLDQSSKVGYSRANISDGQAIAGGTAAIGDLVKGGGSQRIGVAWTEGGWKRRA